MSESVTSNNKDCLDNINQHGVELELQTVLLTVILDDKDCLDNIK